MNEDRINQPGIVATRDLSLADIAATAGPDFASWLCGLFGGEDPSEGAEAGSGEVV